MRLKRFCGKHTCAHVNKHAKHSLGLTMATGKTAIWNESRSEAEAAVSEQKSLVSAAPGEVLGVLLLNPVTSHTALCVSAALCVSGCQLMSCADGS